MLWVSSRRLACSHLGRRHLISFRRFINKFARMPLVRTQPNTQRLGWAKLPSPRRPHRKSHERFLKSVHSVNALVSMRINKTSCTVAVLLVVTILKIFVDPIEMDPAIEQHEREQESKLVDDFYSYVTQPVHGHSFGFQDHSHISRHSVSCAFRITGTRTPCSCCNGAMTFRAAENLVDGMLQQPPEPVGGHGKSTTLRVNEIPQSTVFGIINLARMFGLSSNKAALNASFGTGEDGEGSRHSNVLWGTNGLISRTLAYWRGGIMSMYRELCRLRAENCRLRAEAREEKLKRKAEEERLKEEHKAEEERLKERIKGLEERNKAVQEALKRAEEHIQTQARARARSSTIKGALEEVEASRLDGAEQRRIQQRRPRHRTVQGEPVKSAAARRSAAATDSGKLSRSTIARRRFKYLPYMLAIIKEAGPVHLPGESCPDIEKDRAGHYDYQCRVLLACLDRPMKAGLLRGLNARIERMIKYVRVYKKAIAHHQ